MEERKGRRVVLFPMPLQGHINPMLQLAQILHTKGFSIAIVHTNFNAPNPSNYPHFTFHPTPDGLDRSDPATTSNVASLLYHLTTWCEGPFEECLGELMGDETGEPIACLVSDALFHFTQGVSERLRIPRIVLRTGGACSFHVFAAFPFLREKGYLPVQESMLEDPITEFPPLKVGDLPVISTTEPEKLYQLVTSMVSSAKNSSGVIFNTFEDLEQSSLDTLRQEFTIPIFPIGPFHKACPPSSSSLMAHDETCVSWLDRHEPRSVIYVSFGSIAVLKESEHDEISCGLRNSGRPFLWVVRPGSVDAAADRINSGIEDQGRIVTWAPQLEVLSHPSVGAFWTHCGWNSTLESISEGVPMICMPCFTDQKVNSRFVCDVWRVGVELDNSTNGLEKGKIESTIRRLFDEKEGEQIRRRVLELKEKASLCLKQEGSSFRSIDNLARHILSLESLTFGARDPSV